MEKQRIGYIDLSKGFCIALVVLFHIKGIFGYNSAIDPFLSSLRLPLYFFLSGLFFKDYGSLLTFLIKKVNRLLIPFFFFYLCFSVLVPNLLHQLVGVRFETVVGWSSLWAFLWPGEFPNVPIWFLWCLFLMNVVFYLLHSLLRGSLSWLAIGCLVLGIVGDYLLDAFAADFGNVFKALQSMPFFYFGYFFSRRRCLSSINAASGKVRLALCVFFASLAFVFSTVLPYHLLLYYASGFSGTLTVILLSSLIGYLPLFSYIGRYSIILLLTHGLLVRFLAPFESHLLTVFSVRLAVIAVTTVILLSYYAIIPLMKRYLPYVTAQKPLLREN